MRPRYHKTTYHGKNASVVLNKESYHCVAEESTGTKRFVSMVLGPSNFRKRLVRSVEQRLQELDILGLEAPEDSQEYEALAHRLVSNSRTFRGRELLTELEIFVQAEYGVRVSPHKALVLEQDLLNGRLGEYLRRERKAD
jgi:hypothetical protein